MSLIWITVSIAGLIYHAAEVAMHEIKTRPFSMVRLPCELNFIQGTEQLKFSWERKDIEEVIKVSLSYWENQKKKDLPKPREPITIFSYSKIVKVLETERSEYNGRIHLDHKTFGVGNLTLLLENVTFADEGVYTCRARSPHGMGERWMKLFVEDEEAPQVQFDEMVASCLSRGWYKNPMITWYDGTTDLSNKAREESMYTRPDGTHRVLSVLHYPVNVHWHYYCLIWEAEKVQRPRKIIKKFDPSMNSMDRFQPNRRHRPVDDFLAPSASLF